MLCISSSKAKSGFYYGNMIVAKHVADIRMVGNVFEIMSWFLLESAEEEQLETQYLNLPDDWELVDFYVEPTLDDLSLRIHKESQVYYFPSDAPGFYVYFINELSFIKKQMFKSNFTSGGGQL